MRVERLEDLVQLAVRGLVPAGVAHAVAARRTFRNRGYSDATLQAAWRASVARVDLIPANIDLRRACVVDIGANEGTFSAGVLGLAPAASIIAAEPNPGPRSRLQARLGAMTNVEIRDVAVSSAAGTATFYLTAHDHNSSLKQPLRDTHEVIDAGWDPRGEISVATVTLDELVGNRIADVVKIDVQGAEMDVLAGGDRTLANARCVLMELNLIPQYAGDATFNVLHAEMDRRGFALVNVSPPSHTRDGTAIFIDGCYARR